MLDEALDVIYPRSCAGCGDGAWPFCAVCVAALTPLEPPWCERCGAPAPRFVPSCPTCPPATITTARAAFLYDGPARRAVHRLKFAGWRHVAGALAGAVEAAAPLPAVDVVTWVPLARSRRAERGFDQARALAVALARRSRFPAERLLRRPTATGHQARRARVDRHQAMIGAFRAPRRVPARILLVDDVLTTGATVAACAAALRDAGAREVHVVAAARSLRLQATLRRSPSRAYPPVGSRPGLWLPGDVPR